MTYNSFMILRYKKLMQHTRCVVIFLSMIIPALVTLILIRPYAPIVFQAGLLLSGWLTWTFAEYMLHRFGHHASDRKIHNHAQELHHHHHTHPTEIRVTSLQRIFLFVISSASLWLSFILNNYFTFLCGIVCGISGFFLMHFILHHQWS